MAEDHNLPTIKQTADIEKAKELARNVFNEANPYDRSKATTLDDSTATVDYNVGIPTTNGVRREGMLAKNRYNAANEYKPTD